MKLNKEQRRAEYEGYNAYITYMQEKTDESMENAYKAFVTYCELLTGYKAIKFDFVAILCGHMNSDKKDEMFVKTYRAYRTVCEKMEKLHNAKVNHKEMNAPTEKASTSVSRKAKKDAEHQAKIENIFERLGKGEIDYVTAREMAKAV